ncbi:MAG: cyclophilin-like fold protein [Syntrophales bacterium]|jgi:hypothetical protein|nr:cyclophilin-like fold protein [Syntrophales bacterium]MDY0045059.1 cyclophilin-like fold protein [Syntrophales bacterium]
MPLPVTIIFNDISVKGELFDSPCSQAIAGRLPIESVFEQWGDEFYFPVNANLSLDESATTNVNTGDIGYWPPGDALCIFFGPTPMSTGPKPVPAGKVNLIGRIFGDASELKNAKSAAVIRIAAVE